MRPRHVPPILAACLAALSQPGCAGLGEVRGPFTGQIVDADTGKPIGGVVVLAVWETLAFTPLGHGGQAFYDTREAISDGEGRFTVPHLPVPFGRTDVQPPELFFFAPTHVLSGPNLLPGPIPARAVRVRTRLAYPWDVTPPDAQPFIAPTIVRVRQIKSKEEWCRYDFNLPPLEHSMAQKMPLTLEAIRREERVRGRCP